MLAYIIPAPWIRHGIYTSIPIFQCSMGIRPRLQVNPVELHVTRVVSARFGSNLQLCGPEQAEVWRMGDESRSIGVCLQIGKPYDNGDLMRVYGDLMEFNGIAHLVI